MQIDGKCAGHCIVQKKYFFGTGGKSEYFQADLLTVQDYYPFGMLMLDRIIGGGTNTPCVVVDGATTVNDHQLSVKLELSKGEGQPKMLFLIIKMRLKRQLSNK
ncbi:MAG: hypothetical protein P0Y53_17460 [Candidatus Pseudobacter hemicellulosilyticus]|uniref:Uncharacterized protein n=1 Tax=Candidatus Pseudobacter hemicellulosilyticus TaxID=3121375 RepID=A0AAJ5WR91_9BACT|nr:MAG: hypothetical protein P0Y53_17460 [Pseudobacter sp.]